MTANGTIWFPQSLDSALPVYLAVVHAIESDIASTTLKAGDKLPPQRALAEKLNVDFTTISRAYKEGQKRGLLVARVGQGTFIAQQEQSPFETKNSQPSLIDMGMNIPPLPEDFLLVKRMKEEMAETMRQLNPVTLFGYQDFFGTLDEREIATNWVVQRYDHAKFDQMLICPGTQSTLLALLGHLVHKDSVVCSENLTYPGFKAAVDKLGLHHVGLEMDEKGIIPASFETACKTNKISVLYCTPTHHNPTTCTWPDDRLRDIAKVAKKYGVKIIEDDAYGFIAESATKPLCAYAPELGYYIAGLAKCLSSALRVAFLCCPDRSSHKELSIALRATAMMASPITKAMAVGLIKSGCADLITQAIKQAAVQRQKEAFEILQGLSFDGNKDGFHIWLKLPSGWSQNEFISQMRSRSVRLVTGDIFAVNDAVADGLRVCLGAPRTLDQTRNVLMAIADLLKEEPEFSNAIV